MTQVRCPVGHQFSDTLAPSPCRSTLIPDEEIEPLAQRIVEQVRHDDFEVVVGYLISTSGLDAYVCPHCDRFFTVDESNALVASYLKE